MNWYIRTLWSYSLFVTILVQTHNIVPQWFTSTPFPHKLSQYVNLLLLDIRVLSTSTALSLTTENCIVRRGCCGNKKKISFHSYSRSNFSITLSCFRFQRIPFLLTWWKTCLSNIASLWRVILMLKLLKIVMVMVFWLALLFCQFFSSSRFLFRVLNFFLY